MLGFLTNLGLPELLVIAVIAVLIFGKDLPQAASKAYMQVRKFRGAVDDLRRESGIERELRDIERTVREAEWEARKATSLPPPTPAGVEERPEVRPIPGPRRGPIPGVSATPGAEGPDDSRASPAASEPPPEPGPAATDPEGAPPSAAPRPTDGAS